MQALHEFHKTKRGYIVFAVIELVLLCILVPIAIDTANMFVYAASVLLFIGIIINLKNATTLQINKKK